MENSVKNVEFLLNEHSTQINKVFRSIKQIENDLTNKYLVLYIIFVTN